MAKPKVVRYLESASSGKGNASSVARRWYESLNKAFSRHLDRNESKTSNEEKNRGIPEKKLVISLPWGCVGDDRLMRIVGSPFSWLEEFWGPRLTAALATWNHGKLWLSYIEKVFRPPVFIPGFMFVVTEVFDFYQHYLYSLSCTRFPVPSVAE